MPTFDGFHWFDSASTNLRVNSNFLQLETFVIIINAAIAWLLLGEAPTIIMLAAGGLILGSVVFGQRSK